MDPKERELRQQLAAKLEEARSLLDEGKLEEARAAKDAAAALKEQIDTLEELRGLEDAAKHGVEPPAAPAIISPQARKDDPEAEYRNAYLKWMRGKPMSAEERSVLESRAMSEGSQQDGGYIVPQDIQTQINQFKRQLVSLETFVRTETVTTNSGSRVLEKLADITPFSQLTEAQNIGDMGNPQFQTLTYSIKDYGGILPITNQLLADTDQNLMAYVANWIAKKSTTTRNTQIINLLKTFTAKTLASADDIKKVLNVDLDPDLAAGAVIITNQDAYNWLDEQKDSTGRYLIQPDPTQPSRKMLFGVPITVVANRLLPSDTTSGVVAPVFIGNLQEAIVLFDRQQLSIASTNVGAGAFETNQTKVRAIERFDIKPFDTGAAFYCSLTVQAAS
ncbi:phage major capsid protein [Alicyclobacillus shizuokensis]|uniref:phage major capsid protein n=1 Tax=Alicyclobacillus shizuokensis TaxID=392014 RepID=UPI0008300A6A|nr:phage major capsid protein [Alicyclobacillus shizuokensis]